MCLLIQSAGKEKKKKEQNENECKREKKKRFSSAPAICNVTFMY